jgi:invasion protein IalB
MIDKVTTRAGIAAALVVTGILAGWLGRGFISAPPDVPGVMVFDDWRLVCPGRSQTNISCDLTQDVANRISGAPQLRFAFTHKEDAPLVVITAPFNVLLQAGMGLTVDAGAMKVFPFRVCLASGCIAQLMPDEQLTRSILHAQRLRVTVAGLDGKSVPIELSPKGFDHAVRAMQDWEDKRHSWLRRIFL